MTSDATSSEVPYLPTGTEAPLLFITSSIFPPVASAISVAALSHIAVWMGPGRTELIKTPSDPYFLAKDFEIEIIAAFVAP